jgi:shikimate kinase
MILKLKRTPGIFLVGFMGCGKSTVGHALAEELGWRFADLDEVIEKNEGCTVAEIFDRRGEAAFRLIETTALRSIVRMIEAGKPYVVAVGGGAFLQDCNFELVTAKGVSIWLDCPFDMIERRIAGQNHRPLARDPERFLELFKTRKDGYARAEYRIEVCSEDSSETVRQILGLQLV